MVVTLHPLKVATQSLNKAEKKRSAMELAGLHQRVFAMPPELQQKIFSYLSPDLQTLSLTGHILVTEDRAVFLPRGMVVNVFAMGAGGDGMAVRFSRVK